MTALKAGVYYVTGPVTATNLTGTGVMIYLTGGGNITIGNNNGLHLSAPTSGTYTGIAIFQDPSDPETFDMRQQLTLDVKGAIYMPGSDVEINNRLSSQTNCTLFIARSLESQRQWPLTNAGCAATFGGAAFLSVSIAE